MKTPDYVQVVGFIDQTKINLQADDSGGELGRRAHYFTRIGADFFERSPRRWCVQDASEMYGHAFIIFLDLRGNPLGSLVYSTAWGNGTEYTQVIEWHKSVNAMQR
jgi:hypothetical protein